jgi:hypothetical protein
MTPILASLLELNKYASEVVVKLEQVVVSIAES